MQGQYATSNGDGISNRIPVGLCIIYRMCVVILLRHNIAAIIHMNEFTNSRIPGPGLIKCATCVSARLWGDRAKTGCNAQIVQLGGNTTRHNPTRRTSGGRQVSNNLQRLCYYCLLYYYSSVLCLSACPVPFRLYRSYWSLHPNYATLPVFAYCMLHQSMLLSSISVA